MNCRKVMFCSLFLAGLVCRATYGQEEPKLDLSAGYSYVHVSSSPTSGLGTQSLNGGDLSLSYRVRPWLRLVGDFGLATSGYRSSDIIGINVGGTETTYMLGPRLVLPKGRLQPFAQALFGVAHVNAGMFDTPGKQTDFSWAAGGGIDYRLSRHFSIRAFQVEFLRTNFFELQDSKLTQNNVRASTGIVFRF